MDRVYYAFCQLECHPCEAFEQYQFVLVAIMTTLCKDFRNDFLLWNKKINRMEYCQDTSFIKRFWCRKDLPLPMSYEDLSERRLTYFDINRWIYKASYRICRDYKNPGRIDETVTSEVEQVHRAYEEWTLHPGNPIIDESIGKRIPKPTRKLEISAPKIELRSSQINKRLNSIPKVQVSSTKELKCKVIMPTKVNEKEKRVNDGRYMVLDSMGFDISKCLP